MNAIKVSLIAALNAPLTALHVAIGKGLVCVNNMFSSLAL